MSHETIERATKHAALAAGVLGVCSFVLLALPPEPDPDPTAVRCGTPQAGALVVLFASAGAMTFLSFVSGFASWARWRSVAMLALVGWSVLVLACAILPAAWTIGWCFRLLALAVP